MRSLVQGSGGFCQATVHAHATRCPDLVSRSFPARRHRVVRHGRILIYMSDATSSPLRDRYGAAHSNNRTAAAAPVLVSARKYGRSSSARPINWRCMPRLAGESRPRTSSHCRNRRDRRSRERPAARRSALAAGIRARISSRGPCHPGKRSRLLPRAHRHQPAFHSLDRLAGSPKRPSHDARRGYSQVRCWVRRLASRWWSAGMRRIPVPPRTLREANAATRYAAALMVCSRQFLNCRFCVANAACD